MKRLAEMKRTIICSIHQPRQAIWDLFSKVEVLSEGYLLYTGLTEGIIPWFRGNLKYTYNPKHDGAPCDWLLDLICVSFGGGSSKMQGMKDLLQVQEASKRFCREAQSAQTTDDSFKLLMSEPSGMTVNHEKLFQVFPEHECL